MLELLLAPENAVFSAALLLMLLIGAIEVAGLGASGLDHGIDFAEHGALDWLGVGRLPLLMLLVVALAVIGLTGLIGQQVAVALTGALLPAIIAVPVALVAAVPLTALAARGVARVLPRDETTAVGLDHLLGKRGMVVVGRATPGSPARVRVRDAFGQSHYVLVVPQDGILDEGDEVLLVDRRGDEFWGIAVEPQPTIEWGEKQ